MTKRQQAGQTRWGRWRSFFLAGSLGLTITLATGCSNTQHATAPPADPLFGVTNPPGMPLPTSAAPAQQTSSLNNQGGVPALPTSNSSTNTATLAAGSWQGPLGRPTPMDNNASGPPFFTPTPTPGSSTQQVPGSPAYVPPNPNPKVEVVPDIQPANPVTPTSSWQLPPAITPIPTNDAKVQPAAAAQPANVEADLSKQLQARGVVDQKRDVVPEGIKLTCYFAQEPSGRRPILEVTAADYPSAARAMLQELDKRK
jgi:hypothetical protein